MIQMVSQANWPRDVPAGGLETLWDPVYKIGHHIKHIKVRVILSNQQDVALLDNVCSSCFKLLSPWVQHGFRARDTHTFALQWASYQSFDVNALWTALVVVPRMAMDQKNPTTTLLLMCGRRCQLSLIWAQGGPPADLWSLPNEGQIHWSSEWFQSDLWNMQIIVVPEIQDLHRLLWVGLHHQNSWPHQLTARIRADRDDQTWGCAKQDWLQTGATRRWPFWWCIFWLWYYSGCEILQYLFALADRNEGLANKSERLRCWARLAHGLPIKMKGWGSGLLAKRNEDCWGYRPKAGQLTLLKKKIIKTLDRPWHHCINLLEQEDAHTVLCSLQSLQTAMHSWLRWKEVEWICWWLGRIWTTCYFHDVKVCCKFW